MEWSSIWPKIDSVYGWLSEDEAKLLAELAKETRRGENVIELGAFMGRSTAALAFGLLEQIHCDNLVISIDTWVGTKGGAEEEGLHANLIREHGADDLFKLHAENMRRLMLHPWSKRIRGTTAGTGPEWATEWNIGVGLVFIDADHRYEAVKADFEAWSPFLPPGGKIAFHDSWAPGPSRVISELPSSFKACADAGSLAAFERTL
jgi:hypothetical protein